MTGSISASPCYGKRRTKIVCTLGPAVDSLDAIERLIRCGMDVARLNFSHGKAEDQRQRLEWVRDASKRLGREVAIMQDLCGPKIRLGDLADGVAVTAGQTVIFDATLTTVVGDRIPLPVPELLMVLKAGNRLMIDDGNLEFTVSAIGGTWVATVASTDGLLKSRKGVSAPGVRIDVPSLSEKDIEDARFGLSIGVDAIAMSFVRDPADIYTLRTLTANKVPLIAKIEMAEAVEKLAEIVKVSDGIMVARGDLGVEMPFEQLAVVQKELISACNRAGKPVITATQMLDSMIERPRPTRAEVTDIANAVLDGTDALMLSGETSVGAFPFAAVETMAKVAVATESRFDYDAALILAHQRFGKASLTDAVSDAATSIAEDMGAVAILCGTSTGSTARAVAKFRPRAKVVALTERRSTARFMAFVRGVETILVEPVDSTDSLLRQAAEQAVANDVCSNGDCVVIIAGAPVGVTGSTNLIKVHRIGDPI